MLKTETITDILNGVCTSTKSIIPLSHQIGKPRLLTQSLQLKFGVLVGIVGDVTGKILFTGERNMFGTVGHSMFGMTIDEEMLASFSGELGNMISAGLSTYIAEKGITSDITSPTIMEGHTTLSGFEKAFHIQVTFENREILDIYLMLD